MGAGIMDQHTPHLSSASANQAPIPMGEFVALVACVTALTALGIDAMLPALSAIAGDLGVTNANHAQYVITAYLLGFAVAQLGYGPLSDRYGRRPVLASALAAYAVTTMLAAASGSFELLLVSRALMGAGAAGARVVAIALVRDCFAGRSMARVMSLVSMVFMATPVLAPSFGQAILAVGSWRLIFWAAAGLGAIVLVWFWLRMPETLAAHSRQPLSVRRIAGDYALAVKDRAAVGYTLAISALLGGLFGFIGSVAQIVEEVFGRPDLMGLIFAAIAGTMAVGSFLNSRIVMRLGMRPISHTALVCMIVLATVHLAIAWAGYETLWSFVILQGLMMMSFGLATSNFSAMAMERMGEIAGTASSLQGFVTTLSGAVLGAVIGQAFDGTTVPLYLGFVAVGVVALGIVAVTERGRLFRPS
jgi:DHA1 family bicyclomycin/chloramphenicol resistance-like MFS transporter